MGGGCLSSGAVGVEAERLFHEFVRGEGHSHHRGDLDVVDAQTTVQAVPNSMLLGNDVQGVVPCAGQKTIYILRLYLLRLHGQYFLNYMSSTPLGY